MLCQMLSIKHTELLAVDKKPAARKLLLANTNPKHFVAQLDHLVEKRVPCLLHNTFCDMQNEPECQLLVCGPPCTPYSQQRATQSSLGLPCLPRQAECVSDSEIKAVLTNMGGKSFSQATLTLQKRERERPRKEGEREREREKRERERSATRAGRARRA